MKRCLIINVDLEIEIPENLNIDCDADVEDYIFDIELPTNYRNDTLETKKIIDEKENVLKQL